MSLNHYVPNFVLKNFADDTNGLWIMDKIQGRCFRDKGGGDTYDNAFAEHCYNPSNIEEVLTRIESMASPIVKKIIDFARSGENIVVDSTEKGHLCTFLLVQVLRIPRVKNMQWEFEGDIDVLWEMFVDLCENKYPVGLEVEKSNENLTEHRHFEKIIWLRMMEMSINIARVENSAGTALLIGDEPCLMKGFLVKQGDRLTMPLAKDVYIELSRPGESPGTWFELSKKDVQELNGQTYSKSHRFVAGISHDLLIQTRDKGDNSPN